MPAGYGDTDTKGRGGTARSKPSRERGGRNVPTLLDWIDPRKKNGKTLYTEGREYWEEGEVSGAENKRRMDLIKGYEKEDIARSKIKPIKDPEGDKTEARKTAARRKRKGRVGTLLSQGRETLG